MQEVVPRRVKAYVTRDGKDVFQKWLDELADQRARVLIDKTVAKVRLGNLGQHKSVGEGVQEIVLDYGPGYRIYSVNTERHWLSCFVEARKRGSKKRSSKRKYIGKIGRKGH